MAIVFPTGATNIARSTDFNSLVDAFNGNGPHNGMAVTANGTGLGVNVAAGAYTANSTKVQYAGASPAVTLTAADVTNARYDILTADSAGVIAKVDGIASATPQYPAIPANKIRLAIFHVTANLVTLLSGNVYDGRVMVNISKGTATISSGTAAVTVSDRAVKTASKIICGFTSNPTISTAHTHTVTVALSGAGSPVRTIAGPSFVGDAGKTGDVPINSATPSETSLRADTIIDATSFVIRTTVNVGASTTVDYLIIN